MCFILARSANVNVVSLGYHWIMPLLPYGDRLRALRKGFHTFLQPTPAKVRHGRLYYLNIEGRALTFLFGQEYRPLEREAVLQLLLTVVHNPEAFMAHLRQYVFKISFANVYL